MQKGNRLDMSIQPVSFLLYKCFLGVRFYNEAVLNEVLILSGAGKEFKELMS